MAMWVCSALTSLSVMHGKTGGLQSALHAPMHSTEPARAACLQSTNSTILIDGRGGFNHDRL